MGLKLYTSWIQFLFAWIGTRVVWITLPVAWIESRVAWIKPGFPWIEDEGLFLITQGHLSRLGCLVGHNFFVADNGVFG
ncbi:hypothetical protein D1606_00935 [Rummeliibacillus sp. POC4]|nr:hypothetical protein D1606_00935 [Rummeliibacillus sp. POC4]